MPFILNPYTAASGSLSVVGTATTVNSATLALPSGIVAHDTIVAFIGVGGGSTAITDFTEIGEASNPHTMYKLDATGSEGTSLALAFTARSATVIVLRGADNSATPEYVNRVSNINPPSISPSWGTTKTSALLAVAYGANQTAGLSVSGYPSGYTTQAAAVGDRGGGTYTFMAVAAKLAAVASDDPSTFTINQAEDTTVSRTVAFKGTL